MGKLKIEIITRQSLGDMIGITKQAVSKAVNHGKKLRDIEHKGKTGINLYDPMTIQYITEVCANNAIPLPPQFQKEKSDVQLFMDAVDHAWDEIACEDCHELKRDFQTAVVEYVKREKG